MNELAQRIQAARRAKGLTQEQLAEQVGVSRQAVSKWESGQSVPDLQKLTALSGFFGVTTDFLLLGGAPGTGVEEPFPGGEGGVPPAPAGLKEEAGAELARLAAQERQRKQRPGYWFRLALPWLLIAAIVAFYILFWAK